MKQTTRVRCLVTVCLSLVEAQNQLRPLYFPEIYFQLREKPHNVEGIKVGFGKLTNVQVYAKVCFAIYHLKDLCTLTSLVNRINFVIHVFR